jgi:hypothetical protein
MLDIDTPKERIESKGGLILAGKLADLMRIKGVVSPVTKNCGKVLTQLFGALVQRVPDFEAVRPFRESELTKQALGLDTAVAAGTIRLYAEEMTKSPELVTGLVRQIQDCSLRLLSPATFTPIKTKRKEYILLDIDIRPMNNEGTKKEQNR